MKMNNSILPIKSMLSILILLITVSVQAAGKVTVAKNNETSIVIKASETMKGDQVIIRNQIGTVMYQEKLEANESYERIFQFSLFNDGVYIISFENDYKVEYYNIVKNKNSIKLLDLNNNNFSFKPIVKRDQNLARVFLTNQGLKDVKLKIVDNSGEELNSTSFNDELIIKRFYDLSNLPSGDYNLVIEVGDKTFTEVLNVQ